jgi:hypothetical protein
MYCLASRFIQTGASVEGHKAWTHVHNATIRSWLIPEPFGPRKLFLSINEHSSRHSENFELSVEKRISGICSRCEPLEGVTRRPYRSTQTMWVHGSLHWLDGVTFRSEDSASRILIWRSSTGSVGLLVVDGCRYWLDTNLCCSLIDAQVPNLINLPGLALSSPEYGFSSRFATASRCGLTLRLQEYFSKSVGPVKKVLLNYNKNGRSVGVATIIFSQAQSAAEAAKKLDSVKVDGKPMRVSSPRTGS